MKQNKSSSTFCEKFAIRNTRQRQKIYELIKAAAKPMSVFDIEDALNGEICLSTIYRVLSAFMKAKIVTKKILDGNECYYELNDQTHSHYAVCTKCKNRIKLTACPIKSIPNFQITDHSIEIYGLCKDCK